MIHITGSILMPRLPLALLACALALGWGPASRPGFAAPLIVAAASSLQPAMGELGRLYHAAGGERPVFVFGSSGKLTRQLEHGAPYDIFMSAEEAWVAHLARKKVLAAETVTPYALGRLALVLHPPLAYPPGSTVAGRNELRLLRRGGVRHVSLAHPAHAPYGSAARQTLRQVGMWQALRPKLVYGENVRQALTFVETGNADAGFVAESIARPGRLAWLPVDGALHRPIRQALGVHAATPNHKAAQDYLALLFSPEGARVLQRHGLTPLPRNSGGIKP